MNSKILIFVILIMFSISCKNTDENTTEEDDISAFNDISEATDTPLEMTNEPLNSRNVVSFVEDDGVKKIPVWVNGVGLEFIFDTGAADAVISLKEALYLISKGEITNDDFIGVDNYTVANGEDVVGMKINLKEVKIGNKAIYNVEATIFKELGAPLLLGQSVLERFGSYTVDNNNKTITFTEN